MKYSRDDWCKIIDKKTNTIIFAGIIKNIKKQGFISFDNKFFFREIGTSKYIVEDNLEKLVIDTEIPDFYDIVPYRGHNKNKTADVFRDFDITELDKEVEDLVFALNKIDGLITTGSCCGHGCEDLYVCFLIYKTDALVFLNKVLTLFKKDFVLHDKSNNFFNNNDDTTMLELHSTTWGEPAYKAAARLAKYINTITL